MITLKHTITVTAEMHLDEEQIRALDALAGYGTEQFLEGFYSHMGRSYLHPYEKGIRSLFENIKQVCRPALSELDRVRKELK